MDDEKKRRTRSSLNKKDNEIKKAKLTLKDENSNSKGSLSKNTKPKKRVQQKIPIPNDDVEEIDLKLISKGTNCVNLFAQFERGFCKSSALQQIAENSLAKDLRWFRIGQEYESCSRRVTAMQWHPSIPNVLVAGGKDGTITLFSSEEIQNELQVWRGIGPGGTVEDMQFHTKGSGSDVVTASIDGTLTLYNLDVKEKTVLVDTEASESHWFCTVNIHQDRKRVLGGDNKGFVTVHHMDNNKSDHIRLHSSKIRHLEFNPRDPNVIVTASLDKTVKLWDIRKLERNSFTDCLEHDKSISTAQFSLTDGCRLLTTDMDSQLRVYRSPTWSLEHKITHPHRAFQHLTPIRASWHPRADLFVIGRYPDPSLSDYDPKMRSVDVFSARTGQIVCELMDASRLITSLAKFNCTGARMASTCGRTMYFWKTATDLRVPNQCEGSLLNKWLEIVAFLKIQHHKGYEKFQVNAPFEDYIHRIFGVGACILDFLN